jgi:hypothetical protein
VEIAFVVWGVISMYGIGLLVTCAMTVNGMGKRDI